MYICISTCVCFCLWCMSVYVLCACMCVCVCVLGYEFECVCVYICVCQTIWLPFFRTWKELYTSGYPVLNLNILILFSAYFNTLPIPFVQYSITLKVFLYICLFISGLVIAFSIWTVPPYSRELGRVNIANSTEEIERYNHISPCPSLPPNLWSPASPSSLLPLPQVWLSLLAEPSVTNVSPDVEGPN